MIMKKKKKIAIEKKNGSVIKSKTKDTTKKIKILNKEIDYKTYFEYYTLVIFFLFAILFISIIVIFALAIFGSKYLWAVVPITLVFWGISYYLSKKIFKKSQEK